MKTSKWLNILAIFGSILLLFSFLSAGEVTFEGQLKTSLSIASSNCKVVNGSIICSEFEENGTTPYFYENLLDMKISNALKPLNKVRSISEFYHPYAPFSGLTFQAFTAEGLLGEIASLESQVIFSPNIILYTMPDKRTESYGGNFPRLAFRRFMSSTEFGLVGITADATLLLDNWQNEPQSPPDIRTGLIFTVSGELKNEVSLEMETKIGAKEGVTCFGNCLGPLKLQENTVQKGFDFEEFKASMDNLTFREVDLSLSSKFSSDNGFDNFVVNGSKTCEYKGADITLSSSLVVTPNTFLPFAGTSITCSIEPFVFSAYFDETYQLRNAAKSMQFNPDMSESSIEGFDYSGQAIPGQFITFNLTLPTDPVNFTGIFRFENDEGTYGLSSGVFRADLDQDFFGVTGTLAFRENSKVFKIETELDF